MPAQKHTIEDYRQMARDFIKEHGRKPLRSELAELAGVSDWTLAGYAPGMVDLLGSRRELAASETRDMIIDAVVNLSALNGYPPTLAEIGEHVGLSKSTVSHHVTVLVSAGVLIMEPGSARTLRVNRGE